MLLSAKFLRLFHVGRKKLLSKYLRPFEILARKGAVAYELRLPASMSRMLQCVSCVPAEAIQGWTPRSAPFPAVLDNGEVECEVEKVLAHHDSNTGRRSYYVQWKGLPPAEENEWLTESKLKNATDVAQDYLMS